MCIAHLYLQIMRHSDVFGDFQEVFGSMKIFNKKFYAHLTERLLDVKLVTEIRIQIRFDRTLV